MFSCDAFRSGHLLHRNGLESTFGLAGTSAIPSHEFWLGLPHEDDRARVIAEVSAALSGVKPYDTDSRVVWPDGEIHTSRASSDSAQRSEPGGVAGAVLVRILD
jgi:hypothetical protein